MTTDNQGFIVNSNEWMKEILPDIYSRLDNRKITNQPKPLYSGLLLKLIKKEISMIKIINKGAKSHLPFSPAIKAGDFVYVSGQASVDRDTWFKSLKEHLRKKLEDQLKI